MDTENCVACKIEIPKDVSKFLINQKDFLVRKRLSIKIHNLTGEDFESTDCAICPDCRMILVQIFDLEQKFLDIFRNDKVYDNCQAIGPFHHEM